jgi:hypothetical protein
MLKLMMCCFHDGEDDDNDNDGDGNSDDKTHLGGNVHVEQMTRQKAKTLPSYLSTFTSVERNIVIQYTGLAFKTYHMFCKDLFSSSILSHKIAQTYLPDPIRVAPEALSGNGKIV